MKTRHLAMIGITILMIGALFTGAAQVLNAQPTPAATRTALENVRDYVPAPDTDGPSYAVDGGMLFMDGSGAWTEVRTPGGVIVGAVAVDSQRPDIVYMGAANELAIYRSINAHEAAGAEWTRIPLDKKPGGITDIAVDGAQRIVYAGTDTAGVFRLRDVGSSVVLGGHLLLDEPVRQVVTDSSGAALAFVRTDTALYRGENYGLAWTTVDNLHSSPTAIALADTDPATVYVGTVDRGVLVSTDGRTWNMANDGLGMVAGTRLYVDALAVDPINPDQLYVATSFLHGSTTVHQSPSAVATSSDGAATWNALGYEFATNVVELLPVSGTPGAVYALTTDSRTPLALFDAPAVAISPEQVPAAGDIAQSAAFRVEQIPVAWIVAALAALALGIFVTYDLRQRGVGALGQGMPLSALETQTVTSVG